MRALRDRLNRRDFLCTSALVGAAAAGTCGDAEAARFGGSEATVAKRPVVILNMTADALVGYLRTEKPLDEGATLTMMVEALNEIVDQYEGTQVTHLYLNVCYNRAAYRSRVWESYWDDDNPTSYLKDWPLRGPASAAGI